MVSLDECLKALPVALNHGSQCVRPKKELNDFVRLDLSTPRLDKIHSYLWLSGTTTPAQPLHRQRLLRREIVITENPDEHLVEDRAVIFVKPLPEYLLSFEFWTKHLDTDKDLHQNACGLLLSYVWIVAYRTDMRIAHESHLLPKNLDWMAWKNFVEDFLEHVGTNTSLHVSKRYRYGELWLRHLNKTYKLSPSSFSMRNLQYGFLSAPMWYGFFIERNVARLFAVFAFISLILSAMQVGQGTLELQEKALFSRASFGFTVAALFLGLVSVSGVILAWMAPRGYRLLSRRGLKRDTAGLA